MAITLPPKPDDRIQIMVVGLGMVGIGKQCLIACMHLVSESVCEQRPDRLAFIEKMLSLDTEGRYFIRTCGEEPHYAYNRVGLTGECSDERVNNLQHAEA
jgi:hypothetical protein